MKGRADNVILHKSIIFQKSEFELNSDCARCEMKNFSSIEKRPVTSHRILKAYFSHLSFSYELEFRELKCTS